MKASCYFPKGLTVLNTPGRDNLLVHLDYPVIKILLDYSVRKILLDYFVRKILLDSGFSYDSRLLFKAGSCCLPNHDPLTSLPFEQSAASHLELPASVRILRVEPFERANSLVHSASSVHTSPNHRFRTEGDGEIFCLPHVTKCVYNRR